MPRFHSLFFRIWTCLFFSVQYSAVLHGQAVTSSGPFVFEHATIFSALPNGLEIGDGTASEEITALRDDVLRIRITRQRPLPEDASWAVLAQARHSSVVVAPDNTEGHYGFRTHSLIVEIDKKTLRLAIRDLDGNILQQDAQAVRFDGTSFRISKIMPLNEHYFALGDKTGPFDRRDQAFELWNTDAYRFQESTDPLYKSIPFFMAFRAGAAAASSSTTPGAAASTSAKTAQNVYSFGAVDGPLDYYIFAGPTPRDVVEAVHLAHRSPTAAAAVDARLPAVALHLRARAATHGRRHTPAHRPHPRRRRLSRHRLPGKESSLYRRHDRLPRLRRNGRASRSR